MSHPLDALFNPKSVALVGASANPAKLSHIALKNMKGGRFNLYPVNPNADRIMGLKSYPSVRDIPGPVDLAVISLAAAQSVQPVLECAEKRVKVAVGMVDVVTQVSAENERARNPRITESALIRRLRRRFQFGRRPPR